MNKTINNPISSISRFKIFDNVRRVLFNPSLLLIIVLSFYASKVKPIYSLLIVIIIIEIVLKHCRIFLKPFVLKIFI